MFTTVRPTIHLYTSTTRTQIINNDNSNNKSWLQYHPNLTDAEPLTGAASHAKKSKLTDA